MSIAAQFLLELAGCWLKPTKYQRFCAHFEDIPNLANQIIQRTFLVAEYRPPRL